MAREASAAEYFNLDRIIEPCHGVPEFFATNVGYLELVPGPCIRMWCVFDPRWGRNGADGLCELRGRVTLPAVSLIPSRARVNRWLEQHGLIVPPTTGPVIGRPQGTLLM